MVVSNHHALLTIAVSPLFLARSVVTVLLRATSSATAAVPLVVVTMLAATLVHVASATMPSAMTLTKIAARTANSLTRLTSAVQVLVPATLKKNVQALRHIALPIPLEKTAHLVEMDFSVPADSAHREIYNVRLSWATILLETIRTHVTTATA